VASSRIFFCGRRSSEEAGRRHTAGRRYGVTQPPTASSVARGRASAPLRPSLAVAGTGTASWGKRKRSGSRCARAHVPWSISSGGEGTGSGRDSGFAAPRRALGLAPRFRSRLGSPRIKASSRSLSGAAVPKIRWHRGPTTLARVHQARRATDRARGGRRTVRTHASRETLARGDPWRGAIRASHSSELDVHVHDATPSGWPGREGG